MLTRFLLVTALILSGALILLDLFAIGVQWIVTGKGRVLLLEQVLCAMDNL